jgi:ferritin-like metal-binding protein YciE
VPLWNKNQFTALSFRDLTWIAIGTRCPPVDGVIIMDTLRDLFEDTLRDVYYAENAILKALPKMMKAAHSAKLKSIFSDHLAETKGQIARLEQVFEALNAKPTAKECHAIKGIIEEGEELIGENPAPPVLDAGLLAAAQAVEHYEMARYGTLRAWADQLGMSHAAKLLEQTLAEEKSADAKLSVLALGEVNEGADTSREAPKKANTKSGSSSSDTAAKSAIQSEKPQSKPR